MTDLISTDGMCSIEQLQRSRSKLKRDIVPLAEEATQFVLGQRWCKRVVRILFDRGFSKVAVFYAECDTPEGLKPTWLIAGDLPPAFIGANEHCLNGAEALDSYVWQCRRWIRAVREGRSVAKLMPIVERDSHRRVEPSPEFAELLEERVDAIERGMLEEWKDEIRSPET